MIVATTGSSIPLKNPHSNS